MRSLCSAFLLLVCSSAVFGQGLYVTNYKLVSQQPISATLAQATYRADLVNNGAALASATATLTSLAASVQVVPGQGVLNFGPVGSGGQTTSSNTFTIQYTVGVSFGTSDFQWSIQGATGPFANAGPNQTAKVGSTVQLNGSGSTNPSGVGTLTYLWSPVSYPGGQAPSLFWPDRVMPTFTPAVAGNYVFMLTVSNGVASNSATVTISTYTTPPVANAGPNQTVAVNSTVVLNGSASTSVDGRPLTYAWTLSSRPASSAAVLTGASTVMPSFVVDKAGVYTAQLIVNDGLASTPSTVTITTQATQPVANAGPNQVVSVGALVQLNGAGSTDANGLPLTYQWSLITLPSGSAAALSNATLVNPTFIADRAGTYVAQLIVNNGVLSSPAATVTISSSSPLAPTANAGLNQTVNIGATVQLNGGGTDPQNLPLTYSWTLLIKPAASTAILSSAVISNPTFHADVAGSYVAQLIVSNGTLSSSPATVTISTTCAPPTANAGPSQTVGTGATVTLNGSASGDVCSDPLTYSWSLTTRPAGSAATLVGANTVSPTFVADQPGVYVAQLIVNNGFSSSTPATVTITAASALISFKQDPIELTNAAGILTPILPAAAGASGQPLTLSSSNPNIASVPSSAFVPAGAISVMIPVTPGLVGGTASITVTAPGVGSGVATIKVTLPPITIQLDTDLIGETKTVNGTVTLGAATTTGVVVTLGSAPSGIITTQPASISIPVFGTTGSFTLTGAAQGSATLTASAPGYNSASVPVTVGGLGVISLGSGVTVGPNQSATLPVTLLLPAPTGGATIALTSSDPSKLTVTSSVFIAGGAKTPTVAAQVTGVNFGSATITASSAGFVGDSKSVQVTGTLSFGDPGLVLVGDSTKTLKLTLSAPAPAAGLTVNLSSSDPSKATVPATAAFPPYATNISIPLTALAGGSVVIHASAPPNLADTTLSLNILAFGPILIPSNVSVPLGQTAPFAVTLPSAAPPGGVTVSLVSSNTSVVTVTPSVFIAYGSTTPAVQPQVQGVGIGNASITASAPGYTSATQTVSAPATVNFSPATLALTSGVTQNLTLNLSAPAPLSGLVINLSSSNASIASVPATVTFSATATSVLVPVTGVGGGGAVIHASALPSIPDATASITVSSVGQINLPATVSLSPGQSVVTPLTLSTATPTTITVSLTSSDLSKVSVSPASLIIPAGAISSATPVQVTGVAAGSATITATAAGWSAGSLLATVSAGSLSLPAGVAVSAGQSVAFPVTLSSAAPAGGVTVALVSSDSSKASISPSSVFIAAGATSSSQAQVTGVAAGSATITATAAGWATASQPVQVSSLTLSFSPPSLSVSAGSSKNLTLYLSPAATGAGLTVTLNSNNSTVASVPASVYFAAGASSATVPVTGVSAGSATLTASASGVSTTASVTVTSPPIIVPVSLGVAPGATTSYPVSLSNPAGAGGVLISLTVSDTSKATIWPAYIYIPQGATAPTSDGVAKVTGVSAGATTITAASTGYPSASGQVVVGAATPTALSLSPSNLPLSAGSSGILTLSLTGGVAPAGGLTVALSSSNSGVASVQSIATVPAGSASVTISVAGVAAGSAVITASASGFANVTAAVSVSGAVSGSSSLAPSTLPVAAGSVGNLVLTLSGPAPSPSGLIVTISSSNPAIATAPTSLTIPANATSATIAVSGLAVGSTTITAISPNYGTATAQVTVTAPTGIILPSNLTVAPGGSTLFPVSLGSPAGAGGILITLTISDSSKVSLTPSSVYIAQGTTAPASNGVPTLVGLTAGSATITASSFGYPTVSTQVQVGATTPVNTLNFSPSSASVTASGTQSLTLNASAPAGGLSVTLSSSNPAIATVPSSLSFGAGASSLSVPVTGVAAGSVTITATLSGFGSATASVTVTTSATPTLALQFQQANLLLPGTTPQNLTLNLSAPAPAGGLTVNLVSSDAGIATVPATATFPANSTSITIPVTGVAPGKGYMNYPVTWFDKDTVAISATANSTSPAATTATYVSSPKIVLPPFQWVGEWQTAPLPVTLSSPAPAGGVTVTLTSDLPELTVTSTVFIPGGATTPTTTPMIALGDIVSGFPTVTVKAPGYATATLQIYIGDHITLGLPSYLNLNKGLIAPLPVVLPGLAPAGGVTITLVSSNPSKATVTPSVFVPEGTNMPSVMPVVVGVDFGTVDITAWGPPQYNGYIQSLTVR